MALVSIRGVAYSTGIAEMGGLRNLVRRSSADRAEKPTSKTVTVATRTSPRSIRESQVEASALEPSRTNADLSISHRRDSTVEVNSMLGA